MRPSLPAARIMLSAMQHSTSTLARASRGFGPFLTRCMLCVLICETQQQLYTCCGPLRAQFTTDVLFIAGSSALSLVK